VAAAAEGIEMLRRTSSQDYKAEMALLLARLYFDKGDSRAEDAYRKAIAQAQEKHDAPLEAQGLDLLGELLLSRNRLDEAEKALTRAHQLHLTGAKSAVRFSYALMGALRLAQAQKSASAQRELLAEAASLTRLAIGASGTPDAGRQLYLLHHQY